MISSTQLRERFFHVSDIMYSLGSRKSSSQNEFIEMGITPEEFENMFWNCEIGAPDIEEELKRDILHVYSLFTDRLIIWLDIARLTKIG
jgi:hypothetical protein